MILSQLSPLLLPDPTTDPDPVNHLGQVSNTVLTDMSVRITVGVCGNISLFTIVKKENRDTVIFSPQMI